MTLTQERDRDAKLKALDASLVRGIADAEAGRAMPLDETFKRLRAELELPEQSSAK
jgi:antitoxin ParD1/3/4